MGRHVFLVILSEAKDLRSQSQESEILRPRRRRGGLRMTCMGSGDREEAFRRFGGPVVEMFVSASDRTKRHGSVLLLLMVIGI